MGNRPNININRKRRGDRRGRLQKTNTPTFEFCLSAIATIFQLPGKGENAANHPTSVKVCICSLVVFLYSVAVAPTLSHNHVRAARIMTDRVGPLLAALASASLLSVAAGSELGWLPYLSCIFPIFPISAELLHWLSRIFPLFSISAELLHWLGRLDLNRFLSLHPSWRRRASSNIDNASRV